MNLETVVLRRRLFPRRPLRSVPLPLVSRPVTLSATDPDGGVAQQTVQVVVPNQGPEIVGTMPALTITVGQSAIVDVSSFFSDPDGDELTYTASSSNAATVSANLSGSSLTVTAVARGLVAVTVTARDPQGLAAQQRFRVTVPNRGPAAVGDDTCADDDCRSVGDCGCVVLLQRSGQGRTDVHGVVEQQGRSLHRPVGE